MDRIIRIETVGELAIATDEAGRQFVSPAGRWDWKPVDGSNSTRHTVSRVEPLPAVEPIAPPPERRALFSGRRNRAMPRRS